MNERSGFRRRHTLNFTNVGSNDFATLNLSPAYLAGEVIEVSVQKTGGSGTQVTAQVKENGARTMFDSGPLAKFPLQRYELSRQYALAGGQSLQVGVKVDQGADTNISVDVVVEV